jgi:hypothetical protein
MQYTLMLSVPGSTRKLPILVGNGIHMTPLQIQVQPIDTYI